MIAVFIPLFYPAKSDNGRRVFANVSFKQFFEQFNVIDQDGAFNSGSGMQFIWLEVTDSTNTQAKHYWHRHQPVKPVLLSAGQQTAGKGTQGRTWSSPSGCGLYCTLLWPGSLPIDPLTPWVAGRVCDWLHAQGWQSPGLGIKPINDLMVGQRKLGGILTEQIVQAAHTQCVVIGIGINVYTPEAVPPDYPDRAIALDALPVQPATHVSIQAQAQSLGAWLADGLQNPATHQMDRYHHWVHQRQSAR